MRLVYKLVFHVLIDILMLHSRGPNDKGAIASPAIISMPVTKSIMTIYVITSSSRGWCWLSLFYHQIFHAVS